MADEFSPSKMHCHRINTNRRNVLDTHYFLHGHKLEVADSNKYLGVTQ